MRPLSKSKLMAYRQCPKRVWLEVHHPDLRADTAAAQKSFDIGHQVGEIAQQLYDPAGLGTVIEPFAEGLDVAIARSLALLDTPQPIFEAGFAAEGAMAFADVMLPVQENTQANTPNTWRMIEVKSSTSVKDYHREDVAVQAFVARAAGVPLAAIALAHIDNSWTYPGGGDYQGLLVEKDLTDEAFARGAEVQSWIEGAQSAVAQATAPAITIGKHCHDPYPCGFYAHCQRQELQAEHPIAWLPGRLSKGLVTLIANKGITELRDVPDHLLDAYQQRVKNVTLANEAYFEQASAAQALAAHTLPAYFLDFETITFAVPIWSGTRPYQQIPFQFSVHRLSQDSQRQGQPQGQSNTQLSEQSFIDLSGNDPSEAFSKALIAACHEPIPIFVYNAGFENARIRELAARFPPLAQALLALSARVVDLLPIAREFYYHPSQQGSWSIKAVLPALCPDLHYDELDGVQDGGMAMSAFAEAIAPQTTSTRKDEIERQLLDYCKLDTYAMVRLWSAFTGQNL
ncbi:DUF2779 domain-containing protein [Zwartia sp.]|uniref:DUF2779 domain-containing protein n=1 Tax=Zwartia sp. TaxID=2978004 RepID=UPI002727D596|nr:DUF2779 domain-containing protein [Zwartia sp.]MDO9024635.1 DUF2779 domain-containing protein [Zwartia sp.]